MMSTCLLENQRMHVYEAFYTGYTIQVDLNWVSSQQAGKINAWRLWTHIWHVQINSIRGICWSKKEYFKLLSSCYFAKSCLQKIKRQFKWNINIVTKKKYKSFMWNSTNFSCQISQDHQSRVKIFHWWVNRMVNRVEFKHFLHILLRKTLIHGNCKR